MLDWQGERPFSRQFGDIYFSKDSGLEEKRYTFLQGNRLGERFRLLPGGTGFAVGETGFGTGLNFLCTWQLFNEVRPLDQQPRFFQRRKIPA